MLSKTNIEIELAKLRDKRVSHNDILSEVRQVLSDNEQERSSIEARLSSNAPFKEHSFNSELLFTSRVYHKDDIKKLCVDYRLRFLDARFFKGDFPAEAISKIRQLEKEHQTTLTGLKIIAPAKLLKLENADDPLLMAPMGNNYYYLIHKWGKDLHPLRKLLMWPYKNFENLLFTIFIVSLFLTFITPMQAFTKGLVSNSEYLLMFLFMFKAVGGIVLFYGFAKGKNFNTAIWNSKYYNA
ncbi:MAG: hypothetical protein K0U54_03755 [Bacteroidetes bacterium]|nr:hypothetical protein [Bacteroidota bacterium]